MDTCNNNCLKWVHELPQTLLVKISIYMYNSRHIHCTCYYFLFHIQIQLIYTNKTICDNHAAVCMHILGTFLGFVSIYRKKTSARVTCMCRTQKSPRNKGDIHMLSLSLLSLSPSLSPSINDDLRRYTKWLVFQWGLLSE